MWAHLSTPSKPQGLSVLRGGSCSLGLPPCTLLTRCPVAKDLSRLPKEGHLCLKIVRFVAGHKAVALVESCIGPWAISRCFDRERGRWDHLTGFPKKDSKKSDKRHLGLREEGSSRYAIPSAHRGLRTSNLFLHFIKRMT